MIDVQITDENETHCLKLVFASPKLPEPLEIYLHTSQAVELEYLLSKAINELHRRDTDTLLRLKIGGVPLLVER